MKVLTEYVYDHVLRVRYILCRYVNIFPVKVVIM